MADTTTKQNSDGSSKVVLDGLSEKGSQSIADLLSSSMDSLVNKMEDSLDERESLKEQTAPKSNNEQNLYNAMSAKNEMSESLTDKILDNVSSSLSDSKIEEYAGEINDNIKAMKDSSEKTSNSLVNELLEIHGELSSGISKIDSLDMQSEQPNIDIPEVNVSLSDIEKETEENENVDEELAYDSHTYDEPIAKITDILSSISDSITSMHDNDEESTEAYNLNKEDAIKVDTSIKESIDEITKQNEEMNSNSEAIIQKVYEDNKETPQPIHVEIPEIKVSTIHEDEQQEQPSIDEPSKNIEGINPDEKEADSDDIENDDKNSKELADALKLINDTLSNISQSNDNTTNLNEVEVQAENEEKQKQESDINSIPSPVQPVTVQKISDIEDDSIYNQNKDEVHADTITQNEPTSKIDSSIYEVPTLSEQYDNNHITSEYELQKLNEEITPSESLKEIHKTVSIDNSTLDKIDSMAGLETNISDTPASNEAEHIGLTPKEIADLAEAIGKSVAEHIGTGLTSAEISDINDEQMRMLDKVINGR